MRKKIIVILAVIIIGGFLYLVVDKSESASFSYFGGIRLGPAISCTCSGHNELITLYDYRLKAPIELVYIPGYSRLYSYFNVFTSLYMLGSYTPGLNTCMMGVPPNCYLHPTLGTLDALPGTGTSI